MMIKKSRKKCVWGLRMISNGRAANKHIIEYSRNLDQFSISFDEECRRFKNEASSRSHILSHNRSIPGDDRGAETRTPLNYCINACVTQTVRQKLDFSSAMLFKKRQVAVLEAKRHISERVTNVNDIASKTSPTTLGRILSSQEHDLCCSASAQMRCNPPTPNGRQTSCLSPLRTNTEVTSSCDDCKDYDHDTSDTIELHEEDSSFMHYVRDALVENETLTSTVYDSPSIPTSIHQLDIKNQEEHQSPVSVLDQLFAEDADSPSRITLQTGGQPRRLLLEECSLQPNPCSDEKVNISQYVRLVLQASCLNWDQLSKTSPVSQQLLRPSLFLRVEFLPSDSPFDPKILFDHLNEVLVQINQSSFCNPPWLSYLKPRMSSVPLQELVLDEIMKQVDFYLLPRTMEQLVAKDVADSGSWIDARIEVEHIMINISEDILEGSILEIILR